MTPETRFLVTSMYRLLLKEKYTVRIANQTLYWEDGSNGSFNHELRYLAPKYLILYKKWVVNQK